MMAARTRRIRATQQSCAQGRNSLLPPHRVADFVSVRRHVQRGDNQMGNTQSPAEAGAAAAGPRLVILQATYGTDAQHTDVRALLEPHIRGMSLGPLTISNATMRCDPAPGVTKRLRLRLAAPGGGEGDAGPALAVSENCSLDVYLVPWLAGSLHIASALYGSARGGVTDVTGALARRVSEGALTVVVGPELAGGGDPSPGDAKRLSVNYITPRGMRLKCAAEEGKELVFMYGVCQAGSTVPLQDRATSHQW